MQKYLNFAALLLAIAVVLLSLRTCKLSKDLVLNEQELKTCLASIPAAQIDTVFDTVTRVIHAKKPKPIHTTDTLFIERNAPVPIYCYDSVIDNSDLTLKYSITAAQLQNFDLNYKLKVPKEIVRTETFTKTETIKVKPWRVDMFAGYGTKQQGLAGLQVLSPKAFGGMVWIDPFSGAMGGAVLMNIR